MGARGSKRYRQKEEQPQQQQQQRQQGEEAAAEEGPVAVDVEELERKYVAAMRAEAAAIVEAEVRQQQQQQQQQKKQKQQQQHHGTSTSYLRFPTAAASAAASALLAGARAPSTPQPQPQQTDDTAALPRRRRLGEQGKRLSMPPTAAEIFERQYVAEARAAAAAAAEASRHRRPLGADPAPAPAPAADEEVKDKDKDKDKERPTKLTKKFGSFRRHGRGSSRGDDDATARSRTEKRHSLGPLSSSSSSPVPLAAVRSSRSNPRMQAAGAPSSASPVPLGASGSAPVSSQSLAAPSPLLQTRAAGDGARPSSRGDAGSSSVPEPLHHMREPRSSSSSSSRPHSTSPSPSSAAPAEGSPRHRRQHSNESDKGGGGGGGGGKKHRSGHSHRASKSSHHATSGTGGGSSAASGTPVPTPPVEPLVQPLDLSAVATPGSSEQHQRQQPRHEEEKKKEEEEEEEEGPMLTVRGFKNYIAGMVPDASAATICEFVDTPHGVVERELSDTAPIPANINPQKFIVRGTSTLRISPPPPLPQAQPPAAAATTTTTTTTTTTPVQQTGLEVREPPALPRSPLGATTSATTGSSSEESDQPRRLAQRPQPASRLAQQQRDNPRKMLKRQPSRFVTPYGDTQPYRLKKDAEASLTLVQVAHVRKGKHTCWTLALEPACTAADLCVAVLEMSAGLPDETVDRTAIPATLYEVERTSGCTPATFSPETSEHADMVDMDERVLDRYNARPSSKKSQRIFVVHEDTKTRRLSAGLSALAADRVKKPIVVDRSDLHSSGGGDGDGRDAGDEGRGTPPAASATPAVLQTPMSPESSYWVREDEITWVSKISSGSFARVYKGVYRGMLVAVKMLKGKLDEKVITEFRKEFKVLKSVRHENLIKCYGVCFEHNRLSYLFEYAERGTLVHVMMDPNVQFSWANVAEFFAQAARGLQFLHEGGPSEIIHRDLKSQNLLVTRDYRIKLSDFGLSRFNTVSNGTTLGNLCGTMSHAAPEVFTGERFTPKSDVYSMGMILWELSHRTATGSYSPPFKEFPYIHMDIQIIIQASQKHLRPTIPEATPEKLASLIRRCWDKDAMTRPSASGILALLEEIPMERMGLSVADMSGEDAAAAAVVARVQQL